MFSFTSFYLLSHGLFQTFFSQLCIEFNISFVVYLVSHLLETGCILCLHIGDFNFLYRVSPAEVLLFDRDVVNLLVHQAREDIKPFVVNFTLLFELIRVIG
jgi:hypothetical protein